MPRHDTDASDDGQIELKKRARRRLVGAAALALAAIIVLPIVMDREPRQPAQDIQVKIPSQDSSPVSRLLSAKPTPLPEPDHNVRADTEARSPEPAREAAKEAAKAGPAPAEKPQARTAASEKGAEAEKTAPKPADKAAEKTAPKPTADKAEEARAQAALKGAEATGPAAQWVVQLGAYKEEGRVKNLLAKLKQMNVPAFSEVVATPQGERTRVRAGPFKSHEAAEQAQAKARKIGVDGTVAPQSK